MEAHKPGGLAVHKGPQHPPVDGLLHVGHPAEGMAVVGLRPHRPAPIQPPQFPAKGQRGRGLTPQPGRLAADLLRVKAKMGGQGILIPHLMAGEDGTPLHQGEHFLQNGGGICVHKPHLTGGIVQQHPVLPRPAHLGRSPAEYLQHIQI